MQNGHQARRVLRALAQGLSLGTDAPVAAGPALAGLRILIADRRDTVRATLAEDLGALGARTVEAADPEEIRRARWEAHRACDPISVVVLDPELPGLGATDIGLLFEDGALPRTELLVLVPFGRTAETLPPILRDCPVLSWPVQDSPAEPEPARRAAALHRPALPESVWHESTPHVSAQCADRPAALRILLAEDDVVDQQVTVDCLEQLGHQVHVVDDGLEAVRLLRAEIFDLVLMAVQMPDVDGLAATAAIRDRRSGVLDPAVPIIALTSHVMSGDRELFLACGMSDYLTKPIQCEELERVVGLWAARHPGSLQSGGAVEGPPGGTEQKAA